MTYEKIVNTLKFQATLRTMFSLLYLNQYYKKCIKSPQLLYTNFVKHFNIKPRYMAYVQILLEMFETSTFPLPLIADHSFCND